MRFFCLKIDIKGQWQECHMGAQGKLLDVHALQLSWGSGFLEEGSHLHPWLLMQVCNVELAAGRMWHQLVMLLQNLVEALRKYLAQTIDMRSDVAGQTCIPCNAILDALLLSAELCFSVNATTCCLDF